jgi:predicted AAA+ superfamily ATPase
LSGRGPDSKVIESADQITPPKADWIEFRWNLALEQSGISLLVLDEIQKVRDWSIVVKILFDRDRKKNKLSVVLSGSASLSLQSGLRESLAGRYELIKCPHWGLNERFRVRAKNHENKGSKICEPHATMLGFNIPGVMHDSEKIFFIDFRCLFSCCYRLPHNLN